MPEHDIPAGDDDVVNQGNTGNNNDSGGAVAKIAKFSGKGKGITFVQFCHDISAAGESLGIAEEVNPVLQALTENKPQDYDPASLIIPEASKKAWQKLTGLVKSACDGEAKTLKDKMGFGARLNAILQKLGTRFGTVSETARHKITRDLLTKEKYKPGEACATTMERITSKTRVQLQGRITMDELERMAFLNAQTSRCQDHLDVANLASSDTIETDAMVGAAQNFYDRNGGENEQEEAAYYGSVGKGKGKGTGDIDQGYPGRCWNCDNWGHSQQRCPLPPKHKGGARDAKPKQKPRTGGGKGHKTGGKRWGTK
jgi:hypothetical protein